MTNKPIDEGRAHDVEGVLERLESHMGKQDIPVLLKDCREAASLIRQLRDENANLRGASIRSGNALYEARTEVSSLRDHVAELDKALEPFARYAGENGFGLDNHGNPLPDGDGVGWIYLTNGDFRTARAVQGGRNGE